MRDWRHGDSVFLYAFGLIELNGDDLRRDPQAVHKATLASFVARAAPGLRLNEHLDHDDGALVFEHACRLGLEGIVSKRRNSPYRSQIGGLDQKQEPGGAGREAGSRGGLGSVTTLRSPSEVPGLLTARPVGWGF